MDEAKRKNLPMTLFTIELANFDDLTQDLQPRDSYQISSIITRLLLNSVARSNILARIGKTTYAFLIVNSRYQQAQALQHKIEGYLTGNLRKFLPNATPTMAAGIVEFDPKMHTTPEIFLGNAQPLLKIEEGAMTNENMDEAEPA